MGSSGVGRCDIEYRFAEGQYDRLTELAADLVRRRVTVLVGAGNTPAARAAKAATTAIPVVFAVGDDPVKLGLVASLNRPGGNVTGVNFFTAESGAKSLGLLRNLLPAATRVGVLINPDNSATIETWMRDVTVAASTTGLQIDLVKARNGPEIEDAFATLVHNKVDALLAGPDALFFVRRVQLVTLATRHAIPAIYWFREFADAAGGRYVEPPPPVRSALAYRRDTKRLGLAESASLRGSTKGFRILQTDQLGIA
jgi:putative ABC transport system substrate-binding protein